MNILYLHGFRSSGNSNTANVLRKLLPNDNIFSPDLPTNIIDTQKFISKYCSDNDINIIIGTSLGGLIAKSFVTIPKIMINPAFKTNIATGTFDYYSNRVDGIKQITVTDDDLALIHNLQKQAITYEMDYVGLSHILVGTEDDIVSNVDYADFINKSDKITYAKFGHRLTEDIISDFVLPILDEIKKHIAVIKNYQLTD